MTNAQRILMLLDAQLTSRIDLTLYGRAALHLGFPSAPEEHALSRDVDAVLWLGQAEELSEKTNFWNAIEHVNQELADQELYISHFFTESQVILLPLACPSKRASEFDKGITGLTQASPVTRA
jgi:hypothetical protein